MSRYLYGTYSGYFSRVVAGKTVIDPTGKARSIEVDVTSFGRIGYFERIAGGRPNPRAVEKPKMKEHG